MMRTDSATVEWHPEFRNGTAIPVVESLAVGDRRFVVIDPESPERLADAVLGRLPSGWGVSSRALAREALIDALRSLIEPPTPEEPTGLGAVVEDADGSVWIRAARIAHGWHRPMGVWAKYADISTVRVLSEGVTS